MMKRLLVIIYIFIVLLLSIGCIHYRDKYHQVVNAPIKIDTIKITDTVTITPPTTITEIIRHDTIYLPLTDSNKSIIPIERKVYEDSNAKVVISGFQPFLDTLITYPTKTIITQEKLVKTSGNGFKINPSIGIGYGLTNKKLDIYIGLSLTYEF